MHILPTLPNASVDATITDPPYGFYRIAKPNAYLAVFCHMPILAEWHTHITDAGVHDCSISG